MCVTFWWFWWWMSSCVCIVIASRTALVTIILGCAPRWFGIPRRSAGCPGMFLISSPSGGSQVYFLGRLSWSSCDPIHWSTGVSLGNGSLGDRFQESLPCSLIGVISCLFILDWALVVLWAGVRVGSDCSVSFLMFRFLDLVKGSISTDALWSCQSSSCSMTWKRLSKESLNVCFTSSKQAPSSCPLRTLVTLRLFRLINHNWAEEGKIILERDSTFWVMCQNSSSVLS